MDHKQHILVVEDESSIADTIVYALSTEGYTASCFPTATEALRYLEKGSGDLLVLDVGLPDLSGFELCRRIRALSNQKTASIPVLFLDGSLRGSRSGAGL